MNEPKINWTPELAEKYKKRYGAYPTTYKQPTQPKMSDKEEAAMRIQEQSFRGLPVPEGSVYPGSYIARTDSSVTGEYTRKLAQQKEQRAVSKEKRDIGLYRERIKKLRTGTTKEPDYMKEAETLSTKIADIDKSLGAMTLQYEKSQEEGAYVKKTVGGEEAYKSAVSEERKTKLLGKKEQLIKQQQITERNAKIQLYARKLKTQAEPLIGKIDKFEQIAQEVYTNPDKYVSGVIADPVKRKQALLEAINQRAVKEVGIDIEDIETILGIKLR